MNLSALNLINKAVLTVYTTPLREKLCFVLFHPPSTPHPIVLVEKNLVKAPYTYEVYTNPSLDLKPKIKTVCCHFMDFIKSYLDGTELNEAITCFEWKATKSTFYEYERLKEILQNGNGN